MPDFGLLIVALAALLIILAWTLIFSRVLGAVRGYVPGFFAPLFDALVNADTAIYNALMAWADPAVRPFSDLLQRATASVENLVGNPLAFARATYAALVRLFTVEIPYAIRTSLDYAARRVSEAEQAAQALFESAQQGVAGLVADLGRLGSLIAQVEQRSLVAVETAFHAATDYALQLARRVEAYAAGLAALETRRAVDAEQEVAHAAGAEAARIEAEAQSWANEVRLEVGNIAQGLESEVARAKAELGAEVVNFEDLVKQRVEAVVASTPFALAERLGEAGLRALEADVETLVVLGAAEVRKQIKDAESLRARYAPQIRAALDRIQARV